MGTDKFDQEPAEGSRGTVERDLAQHDKPGRGGGGAPIPPAGPHAKPEETNSDATPGAGTLPSVDPSDDVESGTG